MNFKINRKLEEETQSGILYILDMEIDGERVFKVGITTRKVEERVSEILLSFFTKYRYFCYCKPKRFKTTDDMFAKEAAMHRALKEFKYEAKHKFGGSNELFSGIDEEMLVSLYDKALKGEELGVVCNTETED